jgi:protoheme IX farnesyltransferase
MSDTLRVLYGTFKLRIGFAITLCALAGVAVSPGELSAWKVTLLALAVLLSSVSAGAFNQFAERELDAQMERTRHRPFVTGRLQAGPMWLAIIILLTLVPVAAVALEVNAAAAAYVFLGAFVYGIVYTMWLKRTTAWNIVFGGLAGSFAVLAGGAAVSAPLAPAAIILALALFLWTPPHFWSLAIVYRGDYAQAGVPMLPVVIGNERAAWIILFHTIVLVGVSLTPVLFGCGWIYLTGALLGGTRFLITSVKLVQRPGPDAARVNFHASLVQLSFLLGGAILDAALGT